MKNSLQKIAIGGLCLILSQLILQGAAIAHNKVVVIPLGGDKKPQNVISVAKENGDFTDPVAAINSFSDESANNRYLIIIGPGLYQLNETLVMRPYIDIVGSGTSIGDSKLWGLISSSSVSGSYSIIQGANDSSIGNLRVENGCGENTYCSGITNDGASPILFNMQVMVHGSDQQYGIYNKNSSTPVLANIDLNVQGVDRVESIGVYNLNNSTSTLNNIQMTISGADFNVGILTSSSSSAEISHSTINVHQSDANNNGVISNINSTSFITGTSIMVGNGTTNSGVSNVNGSSSNVFNATVIAYSGGLSKGVVNTADSYASIRNSDVQGGTNSVDASTGTDPIETRIIDSDLIGSVAGDPKCWSVTSGMVTLDADCQ